MTEVIAIVTLAAVCVVQAVVLVCRRKPMPIEWTVAQSIAKSIVKTRERGIAEGETKAARANGRAWPEEFDTPLMDRVPYDPEEELNDSRVGRHPDMVPVTDAPLVE